MRASAARSEPTAAIMVTPTVIASATAASEAATDLGTRPGRPLTK
jgi:hypothetical protein